MRKIFSIILVSSLFLFSLSATPITLEDAINSAKENNISLEVAQIELRQNLRSASSLSSWIPDFSLDGSITTSGSPIQGSWSSPLDANLSVGISYNLGTDKIGTAESSRIQTTIANLTYASTVSSLEESITSAYYTLLTNSLNIELAEYSLSEVEETYNNTKEMYENGTTSELNLYQAELSVVNAEAALETAKSTYDLSLESFRILTGIEDEVVELADIEEPVLLNLPSATELFTKYGSNSLSIQISDVSITQSENTLLQTKVNNYYPSVSLSAGYNINGITGINSVSSFTDNLTATVTVSVPLSSYIPGSTGNTNVKNAEDSVEIAKLNLEIEKQNLLTSISSSLTTLKSTENTIASSEKALELAEKTYELKKESYEAGLTTITELTTAQDSLEDARSTLLTSKVTYIQNELSLCRLLGISKSELESNYSAN